MPKKTHTRIEKNQLEKDVELLDVVLDCKNIAFDKESVEEIQRLSRLLSDLEQRASSSERASIKNITKQFFRSHPEKTSKQETIEALEKIWENQEREWDFKLIEAQFTSLYKRQHEREVADPMTVIESNFEEIESNLYALSNYSTRWKLGMIETMNEYKDSVQEVLSGTLNDDFFEMKVALLSVLTKAIDVAPTIDEKRLLSRAFDDFNSLTNLSSEVHEIIEATNGTIEYYLKNHKSLEISNLDNFSMLAAKNILSSITDSPVINIEQAAFLVKKQLEEQYFPYKDNINFIHKQYEFAESLKENNAVIERVTQERVITAFRDAANKPQNTSPESTAFIDGDKLPDDVNRQQEDDSMEETNEDRADIANRQKEAFRRELQQETTMTALRLSDQAWFNYFYDLIEKENAQYATLVYKGLLTLEPPSGETPPDIPVEKGPGRRGEQKVIHKPKKAPVKEARPEWSGKTKRLGIRMPVSWVQYLDKLQDANPTLTKRQIMLTGLAKLGEKHQIEAPPIPQSTFKSRHRP